MAKSPDRTLKHPLPYIRYKALARTRSWLRVDMVISLTMACVCFGFSAILFFGYFKVYSFIEIWNDFLPFKINFAIFSTGNRYL